MHTLNICVFNHLDRFEEKKTFRKEQILSFQNESLVLKI